MWVRVRGNELAFCYALYSVACARPVPHDYVAQPRNRARFDSQSFPELRSLSQRGRLPYYRRGGHRRLQPVDALSHWTVMRDENLKPAYKAPPGTCDTHFHVFGPLDRYPVASRSRYEPPHAPLEQYVQVARALGIERLVFVQPSAYGTDNTYMLESMANVNMPCRGIVDIDENAPDAEIERLHAQGVLGVRINTSPIAPYDAARPSQLAARVKTWSGA